MVLVLIAIEVVVVARVTRVTVLLEATEGRRIRMECSKGLHQVLFGVKTIRKAAASRQVLRGRLLEAATVTETTERAVIEDNLPKIVPLLFLLQVKIILRLIVHR